MAEKDDLDTVLAQHRALARSMPFAWNAFFAGFGALRHVQLAAMPVILAGRNVLVTAPTAGGKTEAALAPISERLVRHRWPGLSVLVVTPTRALVNDLHSRLQRPLEQMGIRLGRKTADHGIGDKIQDQILITTPESVESLLTFRRQSLENAQAIILDEIHLLDGSPRGDQLRCLLRRIWAFRHHVGGSGFAGLQTIAMSATVSDPTRLADTYLATGSVIVAVPGQRQLEARIILAGGTDKERAEAAMGAVDEFTAVQKLLVFVNSRKQVDAGTGYFRCGRFSQAPVYGHHGSLSKSQREETESRFKSDPQAICVATMTLEIGIDIGDIDLVVCIDPPFSLSSFLQRIGRGCRRLNGRTRVLCVARDRAGELMFNALVGQATRGMPGGPTCPFRRSVLFQQVLAYLKQSPKNCRVTEQFARILGSDSAPTVSNRCIQDVLQDMVQTGFLDWKRDVYRPAPEGWSFIDSKRIYANIQPSPLEVALVDVESGKVVATVAGVSGPTDGIRVAGRSYDLVPGGSPFIQRVRGGGDHVDSPLYRAHGLPYAFDVGASLANHFEIPPTQLVAVRVGQSTVVMTWLGRILNSALAGALRQRAFHVSDGSFHLTVQLGQDADLLRVIREGVEDVIARNPLGRMNCERMIDLGPHYRNLSPDLQKKAREDWLDADFLQDWCNQLNEVRVVPADTQMGGDLLALT
ncbi:MAG TPA: DEAD/DEAH box helicase [Pirellulales bacterium]|nr:DEAD/DEAH box helicase [Pirellulales bacterium]